MLMSKPLVSGLLLGFLLGFSFFYLLSNYAPRINRTPQVQVCAQDVLFSLLESNRYSCASVLHIGWFSVQLV